MSDLLLMASSPLRSLLSTPGLVACYLPYLQVAQSLTGQSLLDYSGNGNHAQLGSTAGADSNDPSWGTNALTFGGDDHVEMSPVASWKFLHDGTPWSFFFASDMSAEQQYHIILNSASGSSSNIGIYIRMDTDNLEMSMYRGTFSTFVIRKSFTSVGMRDGNPHLLTLTFDYGKATENLILYRDGTALGTADKIGEVNTANATHNLLMGRSGMLGMTGNIYSGLFYTRAMNEIEVKRNYANLKTLLAGQGVSLA